MRISTLTEQEIFKFSDFDLKKKKKLENRLIDKYSYLFFTFLDSPDHRSLAWLHLVWRSCHWLNWGGCWVQLLPRTWATASTKFLWLPASLLTTILSARTKLDITGCCWHRKRSSTSRQDVMRCGRVPPITVLLPPMVSNTTPTSPMAPHWTARPGRPS